MKRIKPILLILFISLCCAGCKNEDMDQSMQSANESKNSENIEKENNKYDKPTGSEETQGELVYIKEPKATYDPENKIPAVMMDGTVYGSTQNARTYFEADELLNHDRKLSEYSTVKIDQPVKKENVYGIGDRIFLNEYKSYFTLNGYEIYDNVSQFNKDDFFDTRAYEEYFNIDGTIKKQEKTVRWRKNGEQFEEKEEFDVKFIVFDCTIEGDSDWVQVFECTCMEMYAFVEEDNYFKLFEQVCKDEQGLENYRLDYPGTMGFGCDAYNYFDKAICRDSSCRPNFFYTYIVKGETINYKLGALVDADMLDKLCLYYQAYTGPMLTDSVTQKCIKLFD